MISCTSLPAVADAALDAGGVPVVVLPGIGGQGHAFAWCAAMRRQLAERRPFVVVDAGAQDGEHPSDRQARRCWIRAHAADLQAHCVGMVVVERDVQRRSQTRLSLGTLIDPVALRVLVVSTEALARQLADVLLMGKRAEVVPPRDNGATPRRAALRPSFNAR